MSQIVYLADYFAVIDVDKESNQLKTKFRIPEKDNQVLPFPPGLELFSLPNGDTKSETWRPCQFHSVQLTMCDAKERVHVLITFIR